ncbi:hypothetical protein Dimus_036743 [Dionaea muscipula]
MALEAIPSSNDLFNLMMFYDPNFLLENNLKGAYPVGSHHAGCATPSHGEAAPGGSYAAREMVAGRQQRSTTLGVQGRKKKRRRPRFCKNKEEAETQRMTHIVVERNRRKQMNEHLAVLRSLMPESYAQRGDQASIVGGAIEYVKELEHILRSLEAQKLRLSEGTKVLSNDDTAISSSSSRELEAPFSEFFSHTRSISSQYSQLPNKYLSRSTASMANIEVTLIETHANLRILSRRMPMQLSRLVAGFQTLHLSILHLNAITLDPLVLYSISSKVEDGCQLTSVDEIAEAVHHMLRIIEQDEEVVAAAPLLCHQTPIVL